MTFKDHVSDGFFSVLTGHWDCNSQYTRWKQRHGAIVEALVPEWHVSDFKLTVKREKAKRGIFSRRPRWRLSCSPSGVSAEGAVTSFTATQLLRGLWKFCLIFNFFFFDKKQQKIW